MRDCHDGEFIEQDDTVAYGDNANPVTLNAYIYGDGDPVNNDDPSGHYSLLSTLGYAAIAAGQFASDVAAAGEVIGVAGFVFSAAEYGAASVALAIDAELGDTAAMATDIAFQNIASRQMVACGSLIVGSFAVDLAGTLVAGAGAALAATISQNPSPNEAAVLLKLVDQSQKGALTTWLGSNIGGAQNAAGVAPDSVSTETLVLYRAVIQANMERAADASGVMAARLALINATLRARGIQ
jgi:hypothetical protein